MVGGPGGVERVSLRAAMSAGAGRDRRVCRGQQQQRQKQEQQRRRRRRGGHGVVWRSGVGGREGGEGMAMASSVARHIPDLAVPCLMTV